MTSERRAGDKQGESSRFPTSSAHRGKHVCSPVYNRSTWSGQTACPLRPQKLLSAVVAPSQGSWKGAISGWALPGQGSCHRCGHRGRPRSPPAMCRGPPEKQGRGCGKWGSAGRVGTACREAGLTASEYEPCALPADVTPARAAASSSARRSSSSSQERSPWCHQSSTSLRVP